MSDIKNFVERIENLERQQAEISEDIRSVYTEAKKADFNIKALKMLIAKRRRDQEEFAALEIIIAAYEEALGPLATTPLGKASAPRRAAAHDGIPDSLRRASTW